MVRIAVVAVALSVCVMILSLAVIMGFKREITERVVGFAAHVEVVDLRGVRSLESYPVQRSAELEEMIRSAGRVERMAPYAVKGGVVKTPDAILGVRLKGVDGSYDWSFFRENLTDGALPRVGDSVRTKEILISESVARELELGVGDKVEMLFVESSGQPRRDRFKISGLYATGMNEFDRSVVMTDLRNVQRLLDWPQELVSGYEITLENFSQAAAYARQLNMCFADAENEVFWDYAAVSVQTLYPALFDWLKTHNVNAAVILIIMVVVALFNMATALLTLVLERTRMIGLLKAMGMRDGAVRRIFLWRAAFIALRGLAWGNVAGLGLCFVQCRFHLLKLDSEAYLLSEVPVSLGWGWWLLLNGGAAAAIVLLLTIPARVVSTVKPSETIRYER